MNPYFVLTILCLVGLSNGNNFAETADSGAIIEGLLDRLNKKDRVIDSLIQKVESFESFKETVASTIADLTSKLEALTEIDVERATSISNNEANIEELTKMVDRQSRYIEHLESVIINQDQGDDSDLATRGHEGDAFQPTPAKENTRIRSHSVYKRQHGEPPVAFFATLNNTLTQLGADQTIEFDRVVTNIRDGYHPHLGSFIAPVSGLYVFSTTLMSNYGHSNHFKYTKNGVAVSNMFVGGGGSGPTWDSTSQMIVLHLLKGDDISVRNVETDEHLFGQHQSTFSGFLLYESFEVPEVVGK